MGNVSKELNSILNENKDPISLEGKSPALFILLVIVTVAAIYFAVLYYNTQNEKPKKNEKKYAKIVKENILLKQEKNDIEKRLIKIEKEKNLQDKEVKKDKKSIIDKKDFYKIYNSNNEKTLKCYNYEIGKFKPTQACIKSLKKFLKDNSNILRYQVVAVIDEKDKKKYNNFNKNGKELIYNGLSIKRITEITWHIKKSLGNNIIVTSNNYYVESKKNNRGIILKAYY